MRIVRPEQDRRALDLHTIADFGEQWTAYRDSSGYYGSAELLADIFGPLLPLSAISGCRIGDVGSGTGRVVNMLLDAGAAHVVAVEPSDAFAVLQRNMTPRASRVSLIQGPGEALPAAAELDFVVSIGVLHHVTNPKPIVAAARDALRPGGNAGVALRARG